VGFVLPTVSDIVNAYSFRMNVDLRKRERYIKAFCTPSVATTDIVITGRLGRYHAAGDNTDATLLGTKKIVSG
jgi:hypothetical protein